MKCFWKLYEIMMKRYTKSPTISVFLPFSVSQFLIIHSSESLQHATDSNFIVVLQESFFPFFIQKKKKINHCRGEKRPNRLDVPGQYSTQEKKKFLNVSDGCSTDDSRSVLNVLRHTSDTRHLIRS